MATSLGTLSLDVVAKIGGFTAGLSKAEREAEKSAKAIESSMKAIGVAGYAVGTALGSFLKDGIISAANAFPRLIEAAAQFQDIAEKTGGSAEGFAALAVSVKVGGSSMDELTASSVRLTKNLTGVDDESKAAGAALDAIGISIAEFKQLSPDEQFLKLSTALGGFAEGAGKTAIAVTLFGKTGANLLPVLKDIYEQGGAQKILTDEQIKQADDYSDRLTRQKAQIEQYAAALATQALPSINAFTGSLKELIVEMTGVGAAAGGLAANNGMQLFAESAGRALAGLVDYIKTTIGEIRALSDFIGSTVAATGQLLSADLAGARKTGADFRARYGLDEKGFGTAGKAAAKTFVQQFNDQLAQGKRSVFAGTDPRRVDLRDGKVVDDRPAVKFSGAIKGGGGGKGGPKDDATKKLLENELAAFKAMGDQAKEQLADRNRILDLYNQQGLLSVKDYYAGLKAAQDDATQAQAKSLDDQIASLEKFKAAAKKDTDVADAQGKINKLTEERAKLYRQAGIEAIAMEIKEKEAAKAVKTAFDEVNAKVLEFQGNMRAAAEIRFDASNEKLKAQAISENNTAIVQQIALLKQYTLAQASINKAQQEFSLAQGDLQIAEERITIARERGTMGEMESLRASGRARQEAVAVMERHLATLLAINDAARSPEQVQQIERLKVQLEGLKATIDPLADKFNTMFGDAAGNAFGDFLTGAKSAKEAFKDFSTTVINEISRMVAKDLAKSLFASAGDSGFNIGSMLSNLFGGATSGGIFGTAKSAAEKSANATGGDDILGSFIAKLGLGGAGAASGAAVTSANTAMATAATAASTALAALTTAASSAATAMAASAVGGAGIGSALGSLASSLAGANAVGSAGGDALGALIKLQGWSSGGFTGMGAANDPAGIVHKGEFVLDQETTRRMGVANLNRINAGGSGGFSQVNNFNLQGNIDRHTETQLAQEVRRRTYTAAGRF